MPTMQQVLRQAQGGGGITPNIAAPQGLGMGQRGGMSGALGAGFGMGQGGLTGGAIGGGMGMLSGLLGGGLIGTGIGTGIDVSRANAAMRGHTGLPGTINFGPAFASNLSFGNFGRSAPAQYTDAAMGYWGGDGGQGFGTPSAPTGVGMAEAEAAQAGLEQGLLGGEGGMGFDAGAGPSDADVGAALDAAYGADDSGGDGGDGTVICTELHRQGYINDDIMRADSRYGARNAAGDPDLMAGYHLWAKPVAKAMRRSKALTAVVRFFAMPVINEIAAGYGGSFFGSLTGKAMLRVGLPFCRWLGRTKT